MLRADLEGNGSTLLHKGRWGNANIVKVVRDGDAWIVKDFLHCWLPVRHTWGTSMVANELRALARLAGIRGIPESPFRVDPFAFGYRFVEGMTLRHADRDRITTSYFLELESLVREMHARGIAHLDLRNKRNVLITPQGRPAIIDFNRPFAWSDAQLSSAPSCGRWICRAFTNIGISSFPDRWGASGRSSSFATRRSGDSGSSAATPGSSDPTPTNLTDAHAAGAHGKR